MYHLVQSDVIHGEHEHVYNHPVDHTVDTYTSTVLGTQ